MKTAVDHPSPALDKRPTTVKRGYPSITVKCERHVLGSCYAQLLYKPDRLEIVELRPEWIPGGQVLRYKRSECVFFSSTPEARRIYDGAAWNLDEIRAWLENRI